LPAGAVAVIVGVGEAHEAAAEALLEEARKRASTPAGVSARSVAWAPITIRCMNALLGDPVERLGEFL
jgi:hypothetical protein